MKICNYRDVQLQSVEIDDAEGVGVRWVISKDDGAKNFFMRIFDVEPGGYTPEHEHDWEHQVFILEGEGTVLGGAETRPFKAGDVVFVARMFSSMMASRSHELSM